MLAAQERGTGQAAEANAQHEGRLHETAESEAIARGARFVGAQGVAKSHAAEFVGQRLSDVDAAAGAREEGLGNDGDRSGLLHGDFVREADRDRA